MLTNHSLAATAPVRDRIDKPAGKMQHHGRETSIARELCCEGDLYTLIPF